MNRGWKKCSMFLKFICGFLIYMPPFLTLLLKLLFYFSKNKKKSKNTLSTT